MYVKTLNEPGLGNYEQLLQHIFEGLLEKKGKEIINIDLRKLEFAPCDNFVICHGDSISQVRALAESVEEKISNAEMRLGHREGLENAKWILLDYGSVVVHIFQREDREYYKLEDLWGDAEIRRIKEE